MSCDHRRDEEQSELGLPCPWPGCPDGTARESVALMRGSEGHLRLPKPHRVEVEADGGVELFRRRREGDAWTWSKLEES